MRKVPVRVGMAGEITEPPYHYFAFAAAGEDGIKNPAQAGPAAAPEKPSVHSVIMGVKFPTYGGGDFDVAASDMDEAWTCS
jgi:hypothetical protein